MLEFIYKKYKIPVTMNPLEYGTLILHDILTNRYVMALSTGNTAKITVDKTNNINNVEILRNQISLFKYTDQVFNKYIIRTVNGTLFYYLNDKGNTEVFKVEQVTSAHFTKVQKSRKLNNNFITYDFETRTVDDKFEVIACCFYDGKSTNSFYLSDYKDSKDMFKHFIDSLLRFKYNF
jgi:hypothetical protein